MSNSPSLGKGGSEAHDLRDIDGNEFKDGRPPEIRKLAEEKSKTNNYEPSNSNPLQWRHQCGAEELRTERVVGRPVDGRTTERTMCPEVSSMGDNEATKLTPFVRRRGLWDEDEATARSSGGQGRRPGCAGDANPPKSGIRSETVEEGHPKLGLAQSVDPLDSNEVDYERRSPDFLDSSQRQDPAYYTAATERMGTRRTSGCPREQWSTTSTKGTKSD